MKPAKNPVYLDNAATTPMDPRVLEKMLPYFCERYGNPGSRVYEKGLDAEAAVQVARWQVASLLSARPSDILFTSGATESNNLALNGMAEAWDHDFELIISATEHPSVAAVAARLAERGVRLTILEVNEDGRVEPTDLESSVVVAKQAGRQVLVSIMHANNETGTINPIAEIGAICQTHGAVFHCDATQSVGKISVNVNHLKVDLLSLSGHKVYGPKGVGALFLQQGGPAKVMAPCVVGGGQERGLRSGTLNVPGIVGLGAAAELAAESLPVESVRLAELSNLMFTCLSDRLPGLDANGSQQHKVPGALHLSFSGVLGEELQQAIQHQVEVSVGSACATGQMGPSAVMVAMGIDQDRALSSVRFTLGRFTNEDDVQVAMDAVVRSVKKLRARSSRFAKA